MPNSHMNITQKQKKGQKNTRPMSKITQIEEQSNKIKENKAQRNQLKQKIRKQQVKIGRPLKNKQEQLMSNLNNYEIITQNQKTKIELIKDYQLCIQLVKIFSLAGNIQTKAKIQKLINRKIYFISLYPKEQLSFDENGNLIDNCQYKIITLKVNENQVKFIQKVNIVCKQLDDDFISELELLISRYLTLKQLKKNLVVNNNVESELEQNYQPIDSEEIIQELIQYANSLEFNYLKAWNQDKTITYKYQLEEEIVSLKQKLQNHDYKNGEEKPFQDFRTQIVKRLEEIKKETQINPLESLIRSLVAAFDSEFQESAQKPDDLNIYQQQEISQNEQNEIEILDDEINNQQIITQHFRNTNIKTSTQI